jgi:hypothetical protein
VSSRNMGGIGVMNSPGWRFEPGLDTAGIDAHSLEKLVKEDSLFFSASTIGSCFTWTGVLGEELPGVLPGVRGRGSKSSEYSSKERFGVLANFSLTLGWSWNCNIFNFDSLFGSCGDLLRCFCGIAKQVV